MLETEVTSSLSLEALGIRADYGKKQLNILDGMVAASPLKLVGTENVHRPLRAMGRFRDYLPPFPFEPNISYLEYEAFRQRLANVTMALTQDKYHPLDGRYLYGLGTMDAFEVGPLAVDLAQPEIDSQTAFRLVYGATNEMPLRALSYLGPPLQIMERLAEAQTRPPQLQVVFPNHIAGSLNRMDQNQVQYQAAEFARVAQTFVHTYFPNLADYVTFLEDIELERGMPLRNNLLIAARATNEHLSESTKQTLQLKGDNGGKQLNGYYAAAHLLVHDTSMTESLVPLLPDQPQLIDAQRVVSIGGYQEEFFYRLRYEVKPYLPEDYPLVKTIQLFTSHFVPPYFMARGGDMSLAEAVAVDGGGDGDIAKAASHDLAYLRKISEFRGTSLSAFLAAVR